MSFFADYTTDSHCQFVLMMVRWDSVSNLHDCYLKTDTCWQVWELNPTVASPDIIHLSKDRENFQLEQFFLTAASACQHPLYLTPKIAQPATITLLGLLLWHQLGHK